MATNITIRSGSKRLDVTQQEFLKALLQFLRDEYPGRECIIAEADFSSGKQEMKPVAVMMLLKNPNEISRHTELVYPDIKAEALKQVEN